MAIRNILKFGDEILTKKCREVAAVDAKIITLLDDLRDTLKNAGGIGLAAPQVGILKRVAIIELDDDLLELINPEITEQSGSENELEGCLSLPGKWAYVERPMHVKVEYCDRYGRHCEAVGEGLMARAICHEVEHLDGILYTKYITEFVEVDEE